MESSNGNPAIVGRKEDESGRRSRGAKESHPEVRELRQMAHLGRQPLEQIGVNLEHKLEVRSRSTISISSLRARRVVAAGRFLQAAT
jgi:hypothetical protein